MFIAPDDAESGGFCQQRVIEEYRPFHHLTGNAIAAAPDRVITGPALADKRRQQPTRVPNIYPN